MGDCLRVTLRVPIEKIEKRAAFFRERFEKLSSDSDTSIYRNFSLDDDLSKAVAECYFLLSEYYKALHRIPEDHNTEHSKVSALTALAVCDRQLIRPRDVNHFDLDEFAMVNAYFSMRIGCERLGVDIRKLTFEERDRLEQALLLPEMWSLDSYFSKLVKGDHVLGAEVELVLGLEEIAKMEMLISSFHFLEIAFHGPLITGRV